MAKGEDWMKHLKILHLEDNAMKQTAIARVLHDVCEAEIDWVTDVASGMKKIEEIKENISKINDPLEMVRFLDEIQINTAKWCKQNCPEEVIFENGTEIEITISGRMQFLNSIQ